jgi:hypothetical protein
MKPRCIIALYSKIKEEGVMPVTLVSPRSETREDLAASAIWRLGNLNVGWSAPLRTSAFSEEQPGGIIRVQVLCKTPYEC